MSGPTSNLELSSLDEAKQLIHFHPDVIQYVNTIKHVQGSTGITIDRMIVVLETLCMTLYLEGKQAGLKEMKDILTPPPSSKELTK